MAGGKREGAGRRSYKELGLEHRRKVPFTIQLEKQTREEILAEMSLKEFAAKVEKDYARRRKKRSQQS